VTGQAPIPILVGDNSLMSSQLLAAALKRCRTPRLDVIVPGGFTSGEILKSIQATQPQVALISNGLRDGAFAGFHVLRALRSAGSPTRPVLLLDSCERELVVDAFRAGARGVFPRSESSKALARCIHSVSRGQIWANSRELDFLLEALADAKPLRIVNARGEGLLSPREQQVAALVAEGLPNRDIAHQLKLSEHTVKNYVFHIFEKLGVSTRVELVLYVFSQQRPADAPASAVIGH
jgi:two-component system nitrate/nitrite response regulator NarL